MAKITCRKCGAECCDCWGCNTKDYKNGLCPKCQQLEKEENDTKTRSESVLELQVPQRPILRD